MIVPGTYQKGLALASMVKADLQADFGKIANQDTILCYGALEN
jgi:hypothetical protein